MSTFLLLPEQRELEARPEVVLADILADAGVPPNMPCGRAGRCARCTVTFESNAPEPTPKERERLGEGPLAAGKRLACQCVAPPGSVVHVPFGARLHEPAILAVGRRGDVPLDPVTLKRFVSLGPPTVGRPDSDLERLVAIAGEAVPTLSALRALPSVLRQKEFKATVLLHEGEVLAIAPGDSSRNVFGLACDLGTTTVAAELFSLRTGEVVGRAARLNPQIEFGEDLVTRLSYASAATGQLERLRQLAADCLNELISRACEEASADRNDIGEIVVAGNSVMTHLLAGVPPDSIAVAPYITAWRDSARIVARDLGIHAHPEARLRTFP